MKTLNRQDIFKGEGLDDSELLNLVEILLFVSDQPVTIKSLRELIPDVVSAKWTRILENLKKIYQERDSGLLIRSVAGGFEFATATEYDLWIRRFLRKERKKRLSVAALETVAIIAYKQPVTTSDIENIRGVQVTGVLKTLLEKRLIKTTGRKQDPGRPFMYGTTKEFLRYFGLRSLEELPKVKELGDFLDEE